MAAQVSASGVQVCAAACSGVSLGNSLVGAMHRLSISPICGGCPCDWACKPAEPSAKATSIRQKAASLTASCQRNVGAIMSGGKIDPPWGYSIVIELCEAEVDSTVGGATANADSPRGASADGSPRRTRTCQAATATTVASTIRMVMVTSRLKIIPRLGCRSVLTVCSGLRESKLQRSNSDFSVAQAFYAWDEVRPILRFFSSPL